MLLTGDLMNRLVVLSEIFIKELLFNLEMEIASFKLTMTKSNLTIDIQMLSLISDRQTSCEYKFENSANAINVLL